MATASTSTGTTDSCSTVLESPLNIALNRLVPNEMHTARTNVRTLIAANRVQPQKIPFGWTRHHVFFESLRPKLPKRYAVDVRCIAHHARVRTGCIRHSEKPHTSMLGRFGSIILP